MLKNRENINQYTNYFYALSDPITFEVCYIGQTKYPKQRISQHKKAAFTFSGNAYMTCWISGLWERSLEPVFEIIEKTTDLETWMNPEKREYEIIQAYWAKGCPLLNRKPRRKQSEWRARIESAKFFPVLGIPKSNE